jgi:predicted kinase
MAKELFLLRGLPGAGKSTMAKSLGGEFVEADRYFMKYGNYEFDATKLGEAHAWCREQVKNWMEVDNAGYGVNRIVVANTFTQDWEMKPYYDLAKEYGYMVFSIVVENRHGGKNVHNVPDEAIDRMRKRFEIYL